jgi:hypothetical protein
MSDPDDRIDAWLNAEVEPLAPPPGSFERIRRGARRRKVRRATVSAAGAAIVIAAAAVAPGIASTLLHSGSGRSERPVAVGTPVPTSRPAATSSGGGGVESQSSRPVPPPGSALSATTSGALVPPNFQPTSVTFISSSIGAVIGQAGTPGHCATNYCTSLAGTSDYGRSWYGISAPVTGPPGGGQGVGQLRFLDLKHGWAFGPQLWVTNNGGANWTREPTHGMRVTDLETAGDRAFALFARCRGTGADFAAHCTSFSLYTSLAGTDQWQPVPGPAGSGLQLPQAAAGQAASASLVLTGGPAGGQGYLLAPSGELLSGPLTGAAWTVTDPALPCQPGTPGPSGQPSGALLAADSNLLVLVCTSATDAASDTQAKVIDESSDGGAHWSQAGTGLPGGIAAWVAMQGQENLVLLATDAGLYRSGNGGASWLLAQASPGGTAAGEPGFGYVGMTSPSNGVALPADPSLHEVFITTDGGRAWLPQPVSGP